MRVLFITSKLNFVTAGGSVADLHLKALGLAEQGHTVTVVTAFSSGNKIDRQLPYVHYREEIGSARLLTIQAGVYRIIKKYEHLADVIYVDGHIFIYGAGLYRLVGGKVPVLAFFNIRLNCWGDTQDTTDSVSVFKKIKKKARQLVEHTLGVPLANQVDAFVFNTPQVEKLYTDWGFSRNKSFIIEDFVDTEEIAQIRLNSSELFSKQKKSEIVFLTAGRMIKEKGFDLVIKAVAILKNKANFRIIMSGGGPELESLKKLAEDLKLGQTISFPGWVDKKELQNFFKNADVFIFPKWWLEYGSAVLTEAFAYGLPVVVPKGGALEWLSGAAALTFTSDSPEEIAVCMEQLISQEELRKKLSISSLDRAKALNRKSLAKKLEAILQSIVPVK